MAVVQFTGSKIGKSSALCTWSALATGDTGTPLLNAEKSDRSVQVGGTFGGSTTVIEGSNDGVTYFTLTDPAGAALSFTVAGLKQILQVTKYIRPSTSGGAAVVVNVNLLTVEK
jgi:hypothetical protein